MSQSTAPLSPAAFGADPDGRTWHVAQKRDEPPDPTVINYTPEVTIHVPDEGAAVWIAADASEWVELDAPRARGLIGSLWAAYARAWPEGET